MRSNWKLINLNFWTLSKLKLNKKDIFLKDKSSFFLLSKKKSIKIYNGRKYRNIKLKRQSLYLNTKLGSFIMTRQRHIYKKNSLKKKKK